MFTSRSNLGELRKKDWVKRRWARRLRNELASSREASRGEFSQTGRSKVVESPDWHTVELRFDLEWMGAQMILSRKTMAVIKV